MQFTTMLENFNTKLWSYHIKVPQPIAVPFIDKTSRRVVCTLNDSVEFQCALMPTGDGSFFININKKIRDKLGLKTGSSVSVILQKDESEYGLPMPEELKELLEMNEEGNRLFHALTPGKQRNLLYIVNMPKTSDARIARAVIVVDHLKLNSGKINFKQLAEMLKTGSFKL